MTINKEKRVNEAMSALSYDQRISLLDNLLTGKGEEKEEQARSERFVHCLMNGDMTIEEAMTQRKLEIEIASKRRWRTIQDVFDTTPLSDRGRLFSEFDRLRAMVSFHDGFEAAHGTWVLVVREIYQSLSRKAKQRINEKYGKVLQNIITKQD